MHAVPMTPHALFSVHTVSLKVETACTMDEIFVGPALAAFKGNIN
jgi:hypothetical protein